MDSKWPFMLIAFGLVFALGLSIAGLERTAVMNNWSSRRCGLPVMMAAAFFKPASDPRTSGQFAKENFDFCMKTSVEKFIAFFMAPIQSLFSKNVNVASGAMDSLSTMRNIATTLYNTLLSYLESYFKKFNASVYQISRITQYLRMAMRRANAVVISMLYSGLTLFRGMLNTIQFVIKVILIICGIMLAIIIILIFVLFPVIPLIMAVLGSIVATVLVLSMYVAGSVGAEASGDQGGFCFAEDTKILVKENGINIEKSVSEIQLGDELANCGTVTAVIQMCGKDVPLYNLNGIYVSGSHLVQSVNQEWISVAEDERAVKTSEVSKILYCFNTTTHKIPVVSVKSAPILFRDWEEIEDNDIKGQYLWNYTILKMLNKSTFFGKWNSSLQSFENTPLMSSNTQIKTANTPLSISEIKIGTKILDSMGREQTVLGVVSAAVEGKPMEKVWNTELYELENGVWIKGQSTVLPDTVSNLTGYTLITETGEFVICNSEGKKEKVVRDFTDVGHKTIHKTYPFVASRLRTEII